MTDLLPDWLSATLASDATDGKGVLGPEIKALSPRCRVAGPAFVALASQDDNLAVVEAVSVPPPPGCVLVVAGLSTSRTATVGGLMALEIATKQVAGLVTDGLVRDAQEIRELGLPVWCRGTTPTASNKHGPSRVGGTVTIGGTLVQDGDYVIADEDGVVIWPKARVAELRDRARQKRDSDEARLARLRQSSAGA